MTPITIYLLHAEFPDLHAEHYCGSTYTTELPRRLRRHALGIGTTKTASLVARGATLFLVRTWSRTSRALELKIQRRRIEQTLCPLCRPLRKRSRDDVLNARRLEGLAPPTWRPQEFSEQARGCGESGGTGCGVSGAGQGGGGPSAFGRCECAPGGTLSAPPSARSALPLPVPLGTGSLFSRTEPPPLLCSRAIRFADFSTAKTAHAAALRPGLSSWHPQPSNGVERASAHFFFQSEKGSDPPSGWRIRAPPSHAFHVL